MYCVARFREKFLGFFNNLVSFLNLRGTISRRVFKTKTKQKQKQKQTIS